MEKIEAAIKEVAKLYPKMKNEGFLNEEHNRPLAEMAGDTDFQRQVAKCVEWFVLNEQVKHATRAPYSEEGDIKHSVERFATCTNFGKYGGCISRGAVLVAAHICGINFLQNERSALVKIPAKAARWPSKDNSYLIKKHITG